VESHFCSQTGVEATWMEVPSTEEAKRPRRDANTALQVYSLLSREVVRRILAGMACRSRHVMFMGLLPSWLT
jgi:hypothetical protein